jgi:hypothetical protein
MDLAGKHLVVLPGSTLPFSVSQPQPAAAAKMYLPRVTRSPPAGWAPAGPARRVRAVSPVASPASAPPRLTRCPRIPSPTAQTAAMRYSGTPHAAPEFAGPCRVVAGAEPSPPSASKRASIKSASSPVSK